MRSICVFAVIGSLIIAPVRLCADPGQMTSTSWHGLSGLYVTPTARLIGYKHLAIGFNESKHSEFIEGKNTDRQIRGVLTYGITDWMEGSISTYNNMFMVSSTSMLNNESFSAVHLKVRLLREDRNYWYPEVSLAMRDLTNSTADAGMLENVNNGRKLFLLASKRLFRKDSLGRFMDVHAGLSWDHNTVAGLMGIELTVAPNASLIVEGMYDSPYLDFRRFGQNDVPGRFIFDTGMRVYPELVPGLVLDLGFVGDSEFEFSFGASYVFGM